MPSFMALSVSVLSLSPNMPVKEAESAVNTVSLVEKKLIDCWYTRSLALVVCIRRAMITSDVE